MDTITEQVSLQALYHPQSYITLKSLKDGADHYYQLSAAQVESGIAARDYNNRILSQLQANVAALQEYLEENHDKFEDDMLYDISSIFDISLEKTITVTATVEMEMQITLPLHEIDDFEVSDYNFDFDVSSYRYIIDDVSPTIVDWNVNQ